MDDRWANGAILTVEDVACCRDMDIAIDEDGVEGMAAMVERCLGLNESVDEMVCSHELLYWLVGTEIDRLAVAVEAGDLDEAWVVAGIHRCAAV